MRTILMAAALALGTLAAAPVPAMAEATISQVQFPGARTDVVPVQPRGWNPNGRPGPAPQQYRAAPRRYGAPDRGYGRRYGGPPPHARAYGRRGYDRPYYRY